MSDWNDRAEVKKGNIGEQIVDKYLCSIGLIPYFPVFNGPHPFDRLCSTKDKSYLCIADVKAKARRTYYPDTGINIKSYNEYMAMYKKYNIDIRLYFVDEHLKLVYGGKLNELAKPTEVNMNGKIITYPKEEGIIIYFPLANMIKIQNITDDEVKELKAFSSRNYAYTG